MISKRTVIGMIVGGMIIGIGAASLVQHLGIITIQEEHYVSTGDAAFYTIPAPEQVHQTMTITGSRFNLTLSSPGDGLQIPQTAYRDGTTIDWVHAQPGETHISIRNTGDGELAITGTINRSSDPVWFTFDLMVIISGIVIIGFSMGFTLRKPKGF